MTSSSTVTEQEMRNPSNHPFSHSKFFTFDEDVRIYRMLRGGATVRQVARTLGKPATFIERRLNNAQFKLRIQWVLRRAKREENSEKKHSKDYRARPGPTGSAPVVENFHERLLRRSPYDKTSHDFSAAVEDSPRRRQEWEETPPSWRKPRYFEQLSMAEKFDQVTRSPNDNSSTDPYSPSIPSRPVASKVGQSYANYSRLNTAMQRR
ncbi:unnamed protein product [Phytomonas sp. Hart1]|nr:unnamed protein product [Phytomonas sp. Hart1]|eukprot:CCW69918.1 unnamed protein product [Phytomonas sp. isolate Hart1]